MSQDYITCDGCGVVLDKTSYVLERNDRFNHDKDKVCNCIQCPVCKSWTAAGEWRNAE
jgi:hypothetical protein